MDVVDGCWLLTAGCWLLAVSSNLSLPDGCVGGINVTLARIQCCIEESAGVRLLLLSWDLPPPQPAPPAFDWRWLTPGLLRPSRACVEAFPGAVPLEPVQ